MDDKQERFNQVIDWLFVRLPIIPLVMTVVFLYIFQESRLIWAYRWLQISFGMFLMMPGWLLLFRPNITIVTVNAVYAFLFSQRNTIVEPLIKQGWQQIGDGVKLLIALICLISFAIGVLIFGSGIELI